MVRVVRFLGMKCRKLLKATKCHIENRTIDLLIYQRSLQFLFFCSMQIHCFTAVPLRNSSRFVSFLLFLNNSIFFFTIIQPILYQNIQNKN